MASLTTYDWLQLPQEVRSKLVQIFNIPRSGVGHVNYTGKGAEIVSDGYTNTDLKSIGIASMQQYLNSNQDDFTSLFKAVLKSLDGGQVKNVVDTSSQRTQDQILESWVSKLKEIRVEAEERGLLTEFVKILKAEIKVKK